MKRSRKRSIRYGHNTERLTTRKIRQEQGGGFKCSHCKRWVVINEYMGTANRNHCNLCLWSRHVDIKKGDRRAECHGGMKPVGLTFRIESSQMYGEITLIHICALCSKISINRIAADDDNSEILNIFASSAQLSAEQKHHLDAQGIYLATADDKRAVYDQLFGHGQHTIS